MTRRQKSFIGLTVVIAILAATGFVVGNMTLTAATRRVLESLVVPARQNGVELMLPGFDTARIAGVKSAQWHGLRSTFRLTRKAGFEVEMQFALSAEETTVQLAGNGMARFEANGVSARRVALDGDSTPAPDAEANDVVVAETLIMHLPFKLSQPGKSLRDAAPILIELITNGEAPIRVITHGDLTMTLQGETIDLPFSIISVGGRSRFSLEPDDVRKLASHFEDELTDAEVDLVAENPMKAPNLLRIKDEAERVSRLAAAEDSSVPEDAYRHVLWSYLLAKEFGPDFAKLTTDAHELGAIGNSPADHRMDYRNNEVGRQYAADGTSRSQILARLQTDARVIRRPE